MIRALSIAADVLIYSPMLCLLFIGVYLRGARGKRHRISGRDVLDRVCSDFRMKTGMTTLKGER